MPPVDRYPGGGSTPAGPAERLFAIVPSDANDLVTLTTSVYVGTGGDLRVVDTAGSTVTFKNVGSGVGLPIRIARVLATGTTAGDIVGMS